MLIEGRIIFNQKTGAVSVSGDIMKTIYKAARDVFFNKYAIKCVAFIDSLQTTEEEKKALFTEFVNKKIIEGTHAIALPVKTKKAGFETALKAGFDKDKLFELIKQHFTYDEEGYQKLDEAINKDPNFVKVEISHISDKDKPEILLCFVFSFTF